MEDRQTDGRIDRIENLSCHLHYNDMSRHDRPSKHKIVISIFFFNKQLINATFNSIRRK